MAEPSKRPPILRLGIVATGALVIAALTGPLAGLVRPSVPPLGITLAVIFMASALASLGVGLFGVLRYILAANSRPIVEGERLGLVLSAIPLVAAFIGVQVVEMLL